MVRRCSERIRARKEERSNELKKAKTAMVNRLALIGDILESYADVVLIDQRTIGQWSAEAVLATTRYAAVFGKNDEYADAEATRIILARCCDLADDRLSLLRSALGEARDKVQALVAIQQLFDVCT